MKGNKEIISRTIKRLGILAHLKGYRYIVYSVDLLINDFNRINSLMGIYGDIAKEFNTTTVRAERAIRHAIEVGWSRANVDFVNELFGYGVDANKGKPTNGEFLATVADYILMTRQGKEYEGK